jgi:hypothetical protein
MDRVTPPSLRSPQGGIALSDFEEAEALADSLEAQFQPVTVPSVPDVIELVDMELELYFQTTESEPKLTNPDEVQAVVGGLKWARLWAPTVSRTGP